MITKTILQFLLQYTLRTSYMCRWSLYRAEKDRRICIFLCLPPRRFRFRRLQPGRKRKVQQALTGERFFHLQPTPAVMCTTALPSVAAFTRPASNIVANFIFTNARAIPRSFCKYSR